METIDPSDELHNGNTHTNNILPSIYDKPHIKDIICQCTYSNKNEQASRLELLQKYPSLLNRKLKTYTGEKIQLEVDKSAQPYQSHPYPVPHLQLQIFKQELGQLIQISMLEPATHDKWIA